MNYNWIQAITNNHNHNYVQPTRTKHEKQTYFLASNNHYHLKTSVHLQVTLILKMTEKEAEKQTTIITTADQNICIYMYIIDLEKKDEKKQSKISIFMNSISRMIQFEECSQSMENLPKGGSGRLISDLIRAFDWLTM